MDLERAGAWLRAIPLGSRARRPFRRLYHAALSAATFGRGLRRVAPSGEAFFVSPAHRYVNWNAIEVDAFRRAVAPGAVALDIGANVGSYSLLLARWVGSGGRVFAFEPSPLALEGLLDHVRLNGLENRVQPVAAAVGAMVGSLPFIIEATAGQGRLAAPNATRATLDVPVTTIDHFCADHGITPDFMKVDVEGAEVDVLRGARETIARTRGRLALFVELHPSLWPERGLTWSDVEGEIAALGLRADSLVAGMDPWRIEGVTARLVPA